MGKRTPQNDAPFENGRCVEAGLQGFILIPGLNHTWSHRPSNSPSKPYLHKIDYEKR